MYRDFLSKSYKTGWFKPYDSSSVSCPHVQISETDDLQSAIQEKKSSFGKLVWTIGVQAKYATFHTFPLQKIYHFIESKQSSTQNLHVQVVVKWLLNTYVHNQRQYKSKMTKFEYIIPASGGTNLSALYKYCKHQKAPKLQHWVGHRGICTQPYTLKIC